jgi:phenylpropionate dioxygenase-like ring-hydroxylating dioxygenase large terminal subunit
VYKYEGSPFCIGHINDFLANKPYKITFLNQDWVLWKNSADKVTIIDNACPHAFAPLSNGTICEKRNTIVCPYHRFEFDSNGDHITAENKTETLYNTAAIEDSLLDPDYQLHSQNVGQKSLPFEIRSGFIWTYGYNVTSKLPIPEFGVSGHRTFHSTFVKDINITSFMENLNDIEHFCGSHYDTFFTSKVKLNSVEAKKNVLSYTYSQYKRKVGLKGNLFAKVIQNLTPDVAESKNTSFVPFANVFEVNIQTGFVYALITWYPSKVGEHTFNIYFYETKKFGIVLEFLLRGFINKFRQKAIAEDTDMLSSLYPKVERKISTPNDKPIFELRKILKEMFNQSFKDT